MPLRAVFLDVDGVILDPERSAGEWARLSGFVYADALGGDAAAWGRANQEVFPVVWRALWPDLWETPDQAEAERRFDAALTRALCARMGIDPPDDARCAELGRAKDIYVAERMDAAPDGAAEAIHALAGRFVLHTASGNPSYRIDALLRGMGVREHFGVTAGPELTGVAKYRPGFYKALFALAGVRAEESVVIDDDPRAVADAAAIGAVTVHVPRPGAEVAPAASATVDALARVPALLEAWPGAISG